MASLDSSLSRKPCCSCKEEKDLSEFFKDKRQSDGLYRRCKACHQRSTRRWKDANKDKTNAAATARYARKKDTLRPKAKAWEDARKEVIAEQRKRRYHADPAAAAAKVRDQRYRDIERHRELGRERYHREREKFLEVQRRYKRENAAQMRALENKRRAAKLQAVPAWGNAFFIQEAYDLAKLREKVCGGKWHVDHIVPLQSKLVCGLHVENNLRVIPATVNLSKSNRHWPDMP